MRRAALFTLALALVAALPAAAARPGGRHAREPGSLGLTFESVAFPAADSQATSGWWFPGQDKSPVVVIAPRSSGTMADLLPAVREFQQRGMGVLVFDYRGFGPGSAGHDTLEHVVFHSSWVADMVGALRHARARAPGRHVFAWGQDVGGAVALAAAARARSNADAVAVEGLYRTSQEFLRANGTSTIQGVVELHQRIVAPEDEPLSAAVRLQVPLLAVLAGKDVVTPPAVTRQVASRALVRYETWSLPEAAHEGAETTPGYFDRLAAWFRQWTAYPPGS